MIRALIFDFDGLILDTETPEVQIWQDLYASHGQEFPLDEWVHTVVGATISNLNPITRLEQLTGGKLDHETLQEQAYDTRLRYQAEQPALPGVADLLDSARLQGLRLAVASSSPHDWVDGYLRRLGFYDLFDVIICREDAPRLKPNPDLYLAALAALHLQPDEALALEDSPNGIKAAHAAGLRVVGVPNGITARLGPLEADLVLASLADLPLANMLAHFGDELIIRNEMPGDQAGIRTVEQAAFAHNDEADLVDLIREGGKSVLSLVASRQGKILGHVLFTRVMLEPSEIPATAIPGSYKCLGLGPIAVSPQEQYHGIGSRLMRASLEHVRRLEYDFVVLLGDPAYYSRFGFQPGRFFNLSSDYQAGDAFQVYELRIGGLTHVAGRVHYLPEFAESGL